MKMISALGPEATGGVAGICDCAEHRAAAAHGIRTAPDNFRRAEAAPVLSSRVGERVSATKRIFFLPGPPTPRAASILIIRPSPPLPPAPAWSAESASVPARVR